MSGNLSSSWRQVSNLSGAVLRIPQVKNSRPRKAEDRPHSSHARGHEGSAWSRDRRKLDERWNFALPGPAPPGRPTAKVPAKETSAGPAGVWCVGHEHGPRQIPDKLKTCRHERQGALPDKLKTCRHERQGAEGSGEPDTGQGTFHCALSGRSGDPKFTP